jgi:signal transduction histidine kinase
MISPSVVIALLVAAAVNLVLMMLMLTAHKKRIVHFWFAVLTGGVAGWAFCINGFLSVTHDIPTATAWVQAYYIAAAAIIYGLFEFSLNFPRRVSVGRFVHGGLFLLFISICLITLTPDGMIERVSVGMGLSNTVILEPLYYMIYVSYFLLLAIATVVSLLVGLRSAITKHRHHLARQLKVLVSGLLFSLVLGAWFNLILPLFGNYAYVWIGPLCTIIFSTAALYAITKQGMLDLQRAVARTIVYVLLVIALAILYGVLIFTISQSIISPNYTDPFTRGAVQIVVAIFMALSVQPLKRFFDHLTSSLFYRAGYNLDTVLAELRDVVSNEVKTASLINKTTRILSHSLAPRYISVYIKDLDGTLRNYNGGMEDATPHQSMIHEKIVTEFAHEIPHVTVVRDVDHLKEGHLQHLLVQGHVGVAVQLLVQKQSVGIVFLGYKQAGLAYDAKDGELLDTLSDELALAVQNSLRFREIEQFNETLKERIDEATKELRASNQQLQHLDAAKDEFVSMASHQLRTPLTSVKGYISMVLEGDAGRITVMQQQLLGEAFTSSERMVHLINDFLNVSRLQTGKFMLDRRPIDLSKVIGQEVESLQTTARAHSLRLHYRAPSRFPILYIDEGKIRQVAMNFIDNAIFYSHEHTTISIKLYVDHNDIVLEVHDTGIGVPEAERAKLFTKFFRATNARRQRPDGTGVGLFLAKKVIVGHGGSMVFDSVEGEGSTFGFRLPIAALKDAPSEDETK